MSLLRPEWQTPPKVRTFYSTRNGGVSDPPFHSLNLSLNTGDERGAVNENRMRLRPFMPNTAKWLQQAHSSRVVSADDVEIDATVADAAYTFTPDVVCVVTVADCLPVLFCTADGDGVAAAHAGWRGLAAGVLENTASALRAANGSGLRAWIGPAIGKRHYEIGEETRTSLCQTSEDEDCFAPTEDGKWRADLPELAARRLRRLDIQTTLSELCSYSDSADFFSARRDGTRSGRMAAFIWIDGNM